MVHFDISRVYTRAFEALSRGLVQMILLVLLALASMFGIAIITLLGLATTGYRLTGPSFVQSIATPIGVIVLGVGLIVYLLMAFLLQGMVRELVAQVFAGYEPHLKVAYAWAIHRLSKYIGTAFLMAVGVLAVCIPAVLALGGVVFEASRHAGFAPIFGLSIVSLLLLIPIFLVLFWWILAYYLVAKEDIGGSDALRRSKQLVSQAFGWTFVTIFLLVLVSGLLGWIPLIGLIVSLFVGLFSPFLHGALYEELHLIEQGAAGSENPGQAGTEPLSTPLPVVPSDQLTLPPVAEPAPEPSAPVAKSTHTSASTKIARPKRPSKPKAA